MTVREWDEKHWRELKLKTRPTRFQLAGEKIVNFFMCPACLLPRVIPTHWITCK